MRRFHIIAKATCECNLNCDYCYDAKNREIFKSKVLDIADLRHLIDMVSEHAHHVDWLWHGGEPTQIPIAWYENVQTIFSEYYSTIFTQNIQTNGVNMLKDDDWLKFLKDNNFHMGLSFDVLGQEHRMRVTENVMTDYYNLMNRIIEAGIVDRLCVISVVTCDTVGKMVEMYENLKHFTYTPNYWTASIVNQSNSENKDLEVGLADIENGVRTFFQHVLHDTSINSGWETRLLINLYALLWKKSDRACTNNDCKYTRLGIHPDGEILFCDTPIYNCSIGHVSEFTSISDIFNSDGYKDICEQIDERMESECLKCTYYELCGGGCHNAHIGPNGSINKSRVDYCDTIKMETMLLYEQLQKIDLDEKINPNIQELIMTKEALLPLEIDKYMKTVGLEKSIILDEVCGNFVTTPQYKIFRVFNSSESTNENDRYQIFKKVMENNETEINELMEGI